MKHLLAIIFTVTTLAACQVEDGPTYHEVTSARTTIDFEDGLDSLPLEIMFGEMTANYGRAKLTENGLELTGQASNYKLWTRHLTNSGVLLKDFTTVSPSIVEVKLPFSIDLNEGELGPDLFLTVYNEQGDVLARADSRFNHTEPDQLSVSFVANKTQALSIELAVVSPDSWALQNQYPTKPFAPVYVGSVEVSATATSQQSWLANSFSYVSSNDPDVCGIDLGSLETTLTPTITSGRNSLSVEISYKDQPFLTGTLIDQQNGAANLTGTAQVTYPGYAGEFPISLTVDQPSSANLTIMFTDCALDLDYYRSMPNSQSANKPVIQKQIEFAKAGTLSDLGAVDLQDITRNAPELNVVLGNQKLNITELIKASAVQLPDGRQHLLMFELAPLTPQSEAATVELSFDIEFDQTQCDAISFQLQSVSANHTEYGNEVRVSKSQQVTFRRLLLKEPSTLIVDVTSSCNTDALEVHLDNLIVRHFKYQ